MSVRPANFGGNLVAQRFAASRRHDDEGVAVLEARPNRLLLQADGARKSPSSGALWRGCRRWTRCSMDSCSAHHDTIECIRHSKTKAAKNLYRRRRQHAASRNRNSEYLPQRRKGRKGRRKC